MKNALILLFSLFSLSVFAQEEITCSPDAGEVLEQINLTSSCYQASEVAKACAWGSSVDVGFVAAASEKCIKEVGAISKKDKRLLKTLNKRCNKTYASKQGTMFQSMNAFCQLDALTFVVNVIQGADF